MRFVLCILTLVIIPSIAAAQSFGGFGGGGPSFTLSLDPQYPIPDSRATLTAESDSLDLSNATMVVTAGGAQVYQGNAQPVVLTVGKAGSSTKITVTITTGGKTYTQSVSLQPQDVSLIVEPVASVPPLYPGKAFVPLDGGARVVAVANFKAVGGGAVDPSTLSYVWTVDDTRIANSSGIGRSAIVVAAPLPYRNRTVSVAITNQDNTIVGGDAVSFSPTDPLVRIYENDPLLGIRFDHALTDSFSIGSSETTLFAAPFSIPTATGAPTLQWFLNGSLVQSGSSITLRPSGDGQGSASLSLTALSAGQTAASAYISLLFGKESSNFLGL